MNESTFQQKFGAFALVAAIVLLIVRLVIEGPTVLGITSPLLLGVTGLITMHGDKSYSSGAKNDYRRRWPTKPAARVLPEDWSMSRKLPTAPRAA